MILYENTLKLSMLEYGIEIPVYDTRASRTFEVLKSNPALEHRLSDIHVSRIDEVLTREDLLRVHSADYLGRLFSDDLEQEIIKTYELIDTQGGYHRYDPGKAAKPLTDGSGQAGE